MSGRARSVAVAGAWLGALLCLYLMVSLPRTAWERFGIWLVIGIMRESFMEEFSNVLQRQT